MPVLWGTPTTAPSMDNYLDTQYVKFFEQHSLDLDLLRKAGQWTVVVWVYENIVPIRVNAGLSTGVYHNIKGAGHPLLLSCG